MENDVLDSGDSGSSGFGGAATGAGSAVERAVARSLEARRAAVATEVRKLVEAALVLIQRTGDVQPRVSEIVREAGLSNQAFYKHFRSKHELLVAVLDEGVRILASYLAHRMGEATSPREQVREWIRGMLEQALDAQGAQATRPFVGARARLAESLPEEVARSERQLTELLSGAIARAVVAGELPDAIPDRDAESIYHLAMGWVETRLKEPARATREDAERLEAFALAGVARALPNAKS
jgi:AcrR family transcriptional regulator